MKTYLLSRSRGPWRLLHHCSRFLFGLALVLSAQAQTPAVGTVSGTVRQGQTRAFLEGVVVTLEGTELSTTTERDGRFGFPHVPAGHYRLKTFYTGLDEKVEAITVTAGRETSVEVVLISEVYKLETFVVAGEREGNAASITRQRNADNVVNVVSMDAYGNVADGNIGNFLQNIPGIAANKEAGEIVGVGLRGTPPELNSVTLDGTRSAAAIAGFTPQGDRAALIDQIPSEFIKEIEVTKGNMPDQPADSLGGSVNLVTKSAFDFKNRVFSYRAGINQNTYRKGLDRYGPTAALTYLDTFGRSRQIGVALSGSYSRTTNTRDRVQMEYRELTDFRNTRARTLNDRTLRIRIGGGAKFEYRFDHTSSGWLSANLNYFASDNDRSSWNAAAGGSRRVADYSRVSRAQIEAGVTPRDAANQTAGVAPGFTDTYTEMLNPTWTNEGALETKRSHQYKVGVGGQKTWGSAKLNLSASYNPSAFKNNNRFIRATVSGFGMAIDTSKDSTRPTYIQTYGSTVGVGSDMNRYLATYAEAPQTTREEVGNVRTDLEKSLRAFSIPLKIKTGADYRNQHRWYTTYSPTWNFVGADGIRGPNAAGVNDDNIRQFVDPAPGYGLFNNRMPQRDQFDVSKVQALIKSNPTYFAPSGTSVSTLPIPRIISEGVLSGYAQASLQLGRLNALGGLRIERTEIESQASNTDPRRPGQLIAKRQGDYQRNFPSVHLRYTALRNLRLRASYSSSSARPSISDLVPVTTVNYDSSTGLGTVSQGNSALKPNSTKNYDASAEFYFEPSGVLSAGWFHKDIKNWATTIRSIIPDGSDNGFNGDFAGFFLNTKTNLGGATIDGLELNYNQQFRFLPKPFNGLALFANYTHLRTEGQYADGARELARFVPETYNIGMTYDWRKFQLRTTYHFKSAFLDGYSTDPTAVTRVTADPTVDVNLQYRWSPRLTLFIDYINIFNNSPDWYAISPQRINMSELYGARLNVGVSGRF
jgi:iron complex outermembrane receptor protein